MTILNNNLPLVPYLRAIESSGSFPTFNRAVEAVAHLPSVIEALTWCHSFFIDGAMKALKLKDAHLFALCGSKEVVNQALANGVDFSAQDVGGRTPAFYAALRVSKEIYDEIIRAKPTKKQDIYGGSAAAIWQLIHPNTTLTCAEGTCVHGNTWLEEYCLPKGASLLSTTTAEAETLLKLWKKKQPHELNQFEALLQPTKSAIQRLKNSPPQLAVKAVTADDRGNPLSAGCGLFADRTIKKGELIGEYGGLLTMTPPTNHEYELNSRIHSGEYTLYFDAGAMRTPVSMANDGYPNAHLVVVANAEGLPVRHYLEALSPIEPSEQIVWDYTYNHDIKAAIPAEKFRDSD